jgi:hypothetical protein
MDRALIAVPFLILIFQIPVTLSAAFVFLERAHRQIADDEPDTN